MAQQKFSRPSMKATLTRQKYLGEAFKQGEFRTSISRIVFLAVAVALPVIAAFAVFLYLSFAREWDKDMDLLRDRGRRHASLAKEILASELHNGFSDARLLATSSALQNYLDKETGASRQYLTQELYRFSKVRGLYDQARFLDASGMERERVNFNDGFPTTVPPEKLQNKKNRPYFRDTMALGISEIYFSSLGLNREQGRVELPLKPVIRLAAPVYDDLARKRGVVVLNYLAGPVLRDLDGITSGSPWRILLTDSNGFWLKGLTPEEEWGTEFPQRDRNTLQTKFPKTSNVLENADSGEACTSEGMFLFDTVSPSLIGEELGVFAKTDAGTGDWTVSAFASPEYMQELRNGLLLRYGVELGGVAVVVLLLSGFLASNTEKRRLAGQEVTLRATALDRAVTDLAHEIEGRERLSREAEVLGIRLTNILAAASRVSIIATDTEGLITTFNKGAENMLGYSSEEMVGLKTPGVFHLESEVIARGEELSREGRPLHGFDIFVAVAKKGGFEVREWTYVRKDGKHILVELVVTGIQDNRGVISGYLGIGVDITERKQAEEALEGSRKLMSEAQKIAHLGSWEWDIHSDEEVWSNEQFRIFGYEPGEVEASLSVFSQLLHSEDRDRVLTVVQEAMNALKPYRAEFRILRPDNQERYLLAQGEVYRGADGQAQRMVGTVLDITERRVAEQALRDNEEKFRAMSEAACDALIVIDSRDRIQYWNRAAEEVFGYTQSEVMGEALHQLIVPEQYREDARRGLEKFAATGKGKLLNLLTEFTALRRDGSEFPVERSVAGFSMGGEWYAVGSLRDITLRKVTEYELVNSNNELRMKQAALDADLQAAAEIQKSLLPQASPATKTLEIAWRFAPSETIGGDIFNIAILDQEHLGIYMLDVSGHGVPAALVTVSVSQVLQPFPGLLTRSPLVQNGEADITPPDEVLSRLDAEFPLERFDKFCTVFYLVINHRSGEITYCNAGHPPPILVRASGDVEDLEVTGTIVGLGGIMPFTREETSLQPGDTLVLYTDGCIEHMNREEEEYGQDRLRLALARYKDLPPEEMLRTVEADIAEFGGDAEPEDDISFICIRRKKE
jgi:PAS domain S-box-containing protein